MMQTLLIIKHGAFGDLIQAMGVLQDIRQHFSGTHITLLTAPAYASLLEGCPYVDAVHLDDRRQTVSLGTWLKHRRFDVVIDLQNSDRSRWYRWRWLRRSRWIARPCWRPPPVSGLAGLIAQLQQAGIATPHARQPNLTWLLTQSADIRTKHALPDAYVALLPGASRQHPAKRWPYYAALATQVMHAGVTPIVILGPDEQTLAASFSCQTLSGLDWCALAAVLAHAQAVVGNDTGPCHLAAHVGARGFALFGPTSAERAEINTERFYGWQCEGLADLSVEDVWSRLQCLLQSTNATD